MLTKHSPIFLQKNVGEWRKKPNVSRTSITYAMAGNRKYCFEGETMDNFNTLLAVGKKTEDLVCDYLTTRGNTVINHTEDLDWQAIDTDFEVSKNGKTTTLEVKTDSRINQTNNLFFEVGFDRATGYYDGWFRKCEAEYILFYDSSAAKGYIIDFNKEIIQKNSNYRRWYNRSDSCWGDAYLLPLMKAEQLGLVAHTFELQKEETTDDWE